ncbi:hypothetical protein KV557_37040 [Kitasatospora aureofaciens]|uniref:hypothetical protein n=1 Tax=Kitasatospora aureofaciens TaxID=1894 RepID=UPI001C49319A|nr:hypothetical protein [Kitasatospora aureofaciens]MBV6702646.1 hypothetical protein [Kitasatospora aureofaciens]
MTSFLTHRARVHDEGLPLYRRHSALRTCLTCFAPYGLRATYHHLTVSARVSRRLEMDPDALVRAVEELHEARVLWVARAEGYTAQRRAEKRAGLRRPAQPAWWNRPWWEQSPDRVWQHDPFLHPPLRLPDYVRRQNAVMDGAELPGCPACGDEGPAVSLPTGHGRAELCRTCARVLEPCPCGRRHSYEPALRVGWSGIWQRQHVTGTGEPNPHWPGVQGPARVEQLEAYEVVHPW